MSDKLLPHEVYIEAENIDAKKLFDETGNQIVSLKGLVTKHNKKTFFSKKKREEAWGELEEKSNAIVGMIEEQVKEVGIENLLLEEIDYSEPTEEKAEEEKPVGEKKEGHHVNKATKYRPTVFPMRDRDQLVDSKIKKKILPRATHDDILEILHNAGYERVSLEVLTECGFNIERPVPVSRVGATYKRFRLVKHPHERDYLLLKVGKSKKKS